MSTELIDRLNYASVLTSQARHMGLTDFCGPVALTPFCKNPKSVFNLPELIRLSERQFFGIDTMIAKAGLSVLVGISIDPSSDAKELSRVIKNPCPEIIDDAPEISGNPIRGFVITVNTADGLDGHAFSVIPNHLLPRNMRRDLNYAKASLVVDINLETLIKSISTEHLADYTKVYMDQFGYSEAILVLLTDKKRRQTLIEYD